MLSYTQPLSSSCHLARGKSRQNKWTNSWKPLEMEGYRCLDLDFINRKPWEEKLTDFPKHR